MRRMRFFVVFMIVCLLSCFLFACGDKDKDTQEVVYRVAFAEGYEQDALTFGTKYVTSTIESNLKVKVDSLDELISVSNDNGFPFFDEKAESYNSELSKKIRGYGNEFFADNSLILVFSIGTSHANSRVVNLSVSGDSYVVTLSKYGGVSYINSSYKRNFAHIIEVEKNAKIKTNNVEIETINSGRLYNLEEALEYREIITQEEARSIVYYYNDGKEYVDGQFVTTDYIPVPLEPQELSEDTKNAIKNTIADFWYEAGWTAFCNVVVEQENTFKYLGTYNGRVAFYVESPDSLTGKVVHEFSGLRYETRGTMCFIFIWEN